jgi:hypothetical protein
MNISQNRRKFLQITGGSILTLSLLPLINGCSGFVRHEKDCFFNSQGLQNSIGRDVVEIICLASLAPSSHNVQPWIVKIKEPHLLIVGYDKNRCLKVVDPDNRELFLSIGCFIENFILAAGSFGYNVEMNFKMKNEKDTDLFELKLVQGLSRDYPINRIKERITIRTPYQKKELKSADLKFIIGESQASIHYYTRDSKEGKYIEEATIAANQKLVNDNAIQNELADWFRWSNDEAEQNMDGITPSAMGLGGIEGWFVRTTYTRANALTEGFKVKSIDLAVQQAKLNGGWLVLTSKDTSVQSLIDAGRNYENIMLKVKDRMIAIQPMSQIVEEEPWKTEVSNELGLNEPVQFIMRAGYIQKYPEPVSLRRPVQWFIRN